MAPGAVRKARPPAAPEPAAPLRRQLARWSGPVLIVLAAAIMVSWTWGTWPDILVDFGRELYMPWQITEGRVLYRDLACFQGPLSQYVNALWFTLFGVSLRTLVLCNLVLVGVLTGLLYHAFRQVGSAGSATAACLTFLVLFAFGQYVPIGNYNYLCPYAHEMTHGLLLALAALVAVWYTPRYGLRAVAASGLCLGLAFLTKAEVFVPGILATTLALVLILEEMRPGWQRLLALGGCFAAALVVPPLVAYACLSRAMPASEALTGTLGSWGTMAHTSLNQKQFRSGMGLDHLGDNLITLLLWAVGYTAILAPAAALGLALRRPGRYRLLLGVAVGIGVAAVLWRLRLQVHWTNAARPLPLLLFVTGVVAFAVFLRERRLGRSAERPLRQLCLAVFAFVLLGKMLLNSRLYHYGFVLAMPGTLVMVAALLDWLPGALEARGGTGHLVRLAFLGLLLPGAAVYLSVQARLIHFKNEQVGTGADAFWADRPRATYVNATLRELATTCRPEETLAVLPEGVMVNYLSRRRNPTPYLFFMPFDVGLFGENNMLAAFQAHPPDTIVIAHKDTSEYGYGFFGIAYGQRLREWILRNYHGVFLAGDPPLQDMRFGMLLLHKNPAPAAPDGHAPEGSGATGATLKQ